MIYTYSYMFNKSPQQVSTPATNSSLELKSTGDILNPVVGDVLYFEYVYDSIGNSLQDITGSSIVFKSAGTPVSLLSIATQYIIQESDVGNTIELEYTIKEQSGSTQATLQQSTGVVTGSGWGLGNIQTSFEAIYELNSLGFPKIQQHDTGSLTDVYKLRSLNGTGVDVKAPQKGNFFSFNIDHIEGVGASRSFFDNPIPNWNGSNATIFFKGTLPANNMWFYRFMGATTRYLSWTNSTGKLEVNGISATGVASAGDEVIIILRYSDDPFTTKEPVAGQRTEMYIRVDDGVTPVEHYYDTTINQMAGSDFSYGWDGGSTAIWTTSAELKGFGFSTQFLSDSEWDNLKNYLISL